MEQPCSADAAALQASVLAPWFSPSNLPPGIADALCCAVLCCAVGCILAELLQRKPLFPGKDYIDQLKLIIIQC
jgi:hypothetical protein